MISTHSAVLQWGLEIIWFSFGITRENRWGSGVGKDG